MSNACFLIFIILIFSKFVIISLSLSLILTYLHTYLLLTFNKVVQQRTYHMKKRMKILQWINYQWFWKITDYTHILYWKKSKSGSLNYYDLWPFYRLRGKLYNVLTLLLISVRWPVNWVIRLHHLKNFIKKYFTSNVLLWYKVFKEWLGNVPFDISLIKLNKKAEWNKMHLTVMKKIFYSLNVIFTFGKEYKEKYIAFSSFHKT